MASPSTFLKCQSSLVLRFFIRVFFIASLSAQLGCGKVSSEIGNLALVVASSSSTTTSPIIVSNVSASTNNGTYAAAQVISVTVTFNGIVLVTGSPRLSLNVTPTTRYATYFMGSGTNTLTFQYTVGYGDTAADLDYASTSALNVNGGTLKDVGGNDVTLLTLATPSAMFSLGFNKNIIINGGNPAAPSGLALNSPSSSPATSSTPTIAVSGVTSGDSVKLYTDNTCSTLVGTATSAGASVNITSSSLVDATYRFYATTTSNGATSSCSAAFVDYILERAFTWMSGSQFMIRPSGVEVYGTQGTPAAANNPGSRTQAMSWTDGSGNLWLFGGRLNSVSGTASGARSDLWKFNVTTKQWTWIAGPQTSNGAGTYGVLGVANASNVPPARGSGDILTSTGMGAISHGRPSSTWVDSSGNLWLFGGTNSGTKFNDLWKFNTTTLQWTWMSGSSSANQAGTYGTKGTPSTANSPGARWVNSSVVDSSGNFWLFGGEGLDSNGSNGYLNDLWRFNPTTLEWTWMSGSNVAGASNVHGAQGVADPTYVPHARGSPMLAIDSSDNIWLFGGKTMGVLHHNDLWKYSISGNTWAWMRGENWAVPGASSPDYGTLGVAAATNQPGGRSGGAFFSDGTNLWLLGGSGNSLAGPNNSYGNLYDLWQYNIATDRWIWKAGPGTPNEPMVLGLFGIESASYALGGRFDFASWLSGGKIWVYGGGTGYAISGGNSVGTTTNLSDLWSINLSGSFEWGWKAGPEPVPGHGTFGTLGVSSANNQPGAKGFAAMMADTSGNIWLYGGSGYDSRQVTGGAMTDMWKYDVSTSQWTWIAGSQYAGGDAVYGTMGTSGASNIPGSRSNQYYWSSGGKLWIFGGYGRTVGTSGWLNDMWRFDPTTSEWTWVRGSSNTNQSGTYGTQGTAAAGNTPGGRYLGSTWVDNSGNLWLYGGYGYDGSGGFGVMNDIWKFNTTTLQWTWIAGAQVINTVSTYGTKGTPSTSNTPGARYGHACGAVDSSGNLWLFGGSGYDNVGLFGKLNDLWKFNPTTLEWTWISGDNLRNALPSYGTMRVEGAATVPGARNNSILWINSQNKIFIYSGLGYDDNGADSTLSDTWSYNPTTAKWTWIKGSKTAYGAPTMGTIGVPNVNNAPGLFNAVTAVKDSSGAMWFFGGGGTDINNGVGSSNTLWVYR